MKLSLKEKAKLNEETNAGLINSFTVFSNVWMTLIAPILVAVFITYWFSNDNRSDGQYIVIIFAAVTLLMHVFLSAFQHSNQKKQHTSTEIEAVETKYKELAIQHNRLRDAYMDLEDLSITQITTLSIIAAELDKSVGELNDAFAVKLEDGRIPNPPLKDNITGLMDKHLHNILWPLVVKKGELFSYEESSLYNIALYVYNQTSGKLEVKQRFNDERIDTQNRPWTPGIGHVGMTFLHKEIKCCPNILKSSELPVKTENDGKYYCSFISVPILACEDNEETSAHPHGVLVLTSASESQFNLLRDQFFLSTVSKLLAVYLDKQEHIQKIASIKQLISSFKSARY